MDDLMYWLYTKDFYKIQNVMCFAHNLQFDFELDPDQKECISNFMSLCKVLMKQVDPDNPFFVDCSSGR